MGNSPPAQNANTTRQPTTYQMVVVHRMSVLAFQGQTSAFQWRAAQVAHQLLEIALSIAPGQPFVNESLMPVMPAGSNFSLYRGVGDTGDAAIQTEVWVVPDALERQQVEEGTVLFLSKVATIENVSFNPLLLDLSGGRSWLEYSEGDGKQLLSGFEPNAMLWSSTCKYIGGVKSQEVPGKSSSTVRNVGLASAGVFAAAALAISYKNLGGKEAVLEVKKKDEQKSYQLARSLQRARVRIDRLSGIYKLQDISSFTSTQLDSLREEIETAYEDLGDVLSIEDVDLIGAQT